MIGSWRQIPRSQPTAPRRPEEPPGIFDGITKEQYEDFKKYAEGLGTTVENIIKEMPPDQQSVLRNYQKSREESGNQARKP